jgi:hypothetical protein
MAERIRDLTRVPAEVMVDRAEQCRDKKHFPDKASAKHQAKFQRRHFGGTLSAYKCPVCGHYHITTR